MGQIMDGIETINLYGEKINGCIIREYTNSVLVQCEDGTRHLCRNERVGKKIAKREKKHAKGFDLQKVEAYGKAPNKRAIHHNKRSGKFTRGEN